MKKITALAFMVLSVYALLAQTTDSAGTGGKFTVNGYIDAYYGFDFNEPASGDRPYFVSMQRHNEFNINLAYAEISYSSAKVRAQFIPGFGTYVNANYAGEPGVLKNIIAANAGIRLSKKRETWLDAGVFSSPYTNESAISKDNIMYTRSFAPEFVPYYLSGLKLSYPVNKKLNLYLYAINGWQQIQDVNTDKSIGTQLEYKPDNKWLFNWNTYIGNEMSPAAPQYRARYFSDVYFVYNPDGKYTATGCAYYGIQQYGDSMGKMQQFAWWQANLTGRIRFGKASSVAARAEYFSDPGNVQAVPVTGVSGFSVFSASLGYNYQVTDNAVLRFEARDFRAKEKVYLKDGAPTNNSQLLISSIAVWF